MFWVGRFCRWRTIVCKRTFVCTASARRRNRAPRRSMEPAEHRILNDVAAKPLYAWDSRGHQFRTAYDALRRPTDSFLRDASSSEITVGRSIYGETDQNPKAKNLRGKAVQL